MQRKKSLSNLGKHAAGTGHLEGAQWRSNGLRRQARVPKLQLFDIDTAAIEGHDPALACLIGPLTERIDPIKDVVGTTIPEIPEVEDRVDHRLGYGAVRPCAWHGRQIGNSGAGRRYRTHHFRVSSVRE